MGWRLIKGWETPTHKVEPCNMFMLSSGMWRTENGWFDYDVEYMKTRPDYFQFTPDLPEGWVRPEDTDAEYGWLLDHDGYVFLGTKTHNGDWQISGHKEKYIEANFKAIYPLQKPNI